MAIDRKFLDANHADLVALILAEGRESGVLAGVAQGAQAERDRIIAVEAQLLPGHEALITSLKFDGKTTGDQAATQVLAAEKAKNAAALEKLRGAAPPPAPAVSSATGDAGEAERTAEANLPIEERAKKEFERDPKLQAEFQTVERYTGWRKHEEAKAAD